MPQSGDAVVCHGQHHLVVVLPHLHLPTVEDPNSHKVWNSGSSEDVQCSQVSSTFSCTSGQSRREAVPQGGRLPRFQGPDAGSQKSGVCQVERNGTSCIACGRTSLPTACSRAGSMFHIRGSAFGAAAQHGLGL